LYFNFKLLTPTNYINLRIQPFKPTKAWVYVISNTLFKHSIIKLFLLLIWLQIMEADPHQLDHQHTALDVSRHYFTELQEVVFHPKAIFKVTFYSLKCLQFRDFFGFKDSVLIGDQNRQPSIIKTCDHFLGYFLDFLLNIQMKLLECIRSHHHHQFQRIMPSVICKRHVTSFSEVQHLNVYLIYCYIG
jgi:hypothetical protein